MYSLIEFESKYGQKPEVEVVPDIWLEKEGKIRYCFWPNTITVKQIRKAIEKQHLPEKTWIKYKCRILHTYDSYDNARKKLADVEFTSNLETDAELCEEQQPKRRRRLFRLYSNSSNSDEENEKNNEDSYDGIPSLPTLKTPTEKSTMSKRPIITSCKPSTSTADCSSKRIHIANSSSQLERAVSPPQNISRITLANSEFYKTDFQCMILTKLVSLENSMNLLLPMVKQLLAHFRLSKIPHVEDVPEIPVDTDENLENIERFLNTKQNFDYMVNILAISGGTTIAQMTRRIMEKIITNNYAKNFNWAGRAPKRAFKVLKIKDLIIATVKNIEPNASVNKIENSIKDWLKLSSLRVALAEVRARKNHPVTIMD